MFTDAVIMEDVSETPDDSDFSYAVYVKLKDCDEMKNKTRFLSRTRKNR